MAALAEFQRSLITPDANSVAQLSVMLEPYLESLRVRARELHLAGTVFDSSQQGIIVTHVCLVKQITSLNTVG